MHRRYVTLQKQKPILIPDNILLEYLSVEQLEVFSAFGTGIFSVTIYAEKPGGDPRGGCVLLHFDATTSIRWVESLKEEFVRFAYDVENAARAVESNPLPNAYTAVLRGAR